MERSIFQLLTVMFIMSVLPGCEFLKAATYPTEKGTLGGEVSLTVAGTESFKNSEDRVKDDLEMSEAIRRVKEYCIPSELIILSDPVSELLLVGGAKIIYSAIDDSISEYIEEKRSAFVKDYSGVTNVSGLRIINDSGGNKTMENNGAANESYRKFAEFKCLHLQRKIKSKKSNTNEKDAEARDELKDVAADIFLSLEQFGNGTAMVVRPLLLNIQTFAAATKKPENDGEKAVMQVSISFGITYLDMNNVIQTYQVNFVVPEYEKGKIEDFGFVEKTNSNKAKVEYSAAKDSSIMPFPKNSPVTISVAVTETGVGSKEFGKLQKSFERNSAILGPLLTESLGTHLKNN